MPRKAILIRLAIYVPIIAYLAWGAFSRTREPDTPEAAPPSGVETKDLPRRTFTADDGSQFQVIEVTPEQAEAMGAKLPEDGKSEGDPKAAE